MHPHRARDLVAQHLRVRRTRLSGQVDEPIQVVALVQVDDVLDSRHPRRLDRRVVNRTSPHPRVAAIRDIE